MNGSRAWHRLLHGGIQDFRFLHVKVLAVQRDCIARDGFAPNLQKFFRHFIAFIVSQKNADAKRLVGIAAGNDVDQETSLREPVECSGHSRGSRGRGNAGANRDQKLELRCRRDQSRSHDPGIFARSAGGEQHTMKAKLIGSLSDLPNIRN
jgi:hypothetical protein